MKTCTKCGIPKPFSEFQKDKHNVDGFTYACKECRNSATRKYYLDNPEKQKIKNDSQKQNRKHFYSSEKGIVSSRRAHLKRKFNLTLEEYNILLKKQDFKCAICKQSETSSRNEVLSVDHCHITNKIRGLLCTSCNRGIGLLRDNIINLQNAILYLKKHE